MFKAHKIIDEQQDYVMLQQKIIHLNSELSKYRTKVQDYQENYHYSQLETLKKENLYMKEKINELEYYSDLDMEEYSQKVTELTEKNTELLLNEKSFLSVLLLLNHQYQEDIEELEKLKESKESLTCEIEEFKEKSALLQSQLKDKDNAIQKLQTENEQLLMVNKELEELMDHSEAAEHDLLNQIQLLEEENRDCKTRIEHLQGKTAKDSEEKQRLNEDIQELRFTEERYKEIIMDETKELSLIEKKLEETKEKLLCSQQENEKLCKEKQDLYEEKSGLEKAQKELVGKIMLLKNEIITYSNNATPVHTKKIKPNQDEIQKLTNSLENLYLEIDKYDHSISACLQKINELEKQIDDLTSIINKLQDKTGNSFNTQPH